MKLAKKLEVLGEATRVLYRGHPRNRFTITCNSFGRWTAGVKTKGLGEWSVSRLTLEETVDAALETMMRKACSEHDDTCSRVCVTDELIRGLEQAGAVQPDEASA